VAAEWCIPEQLGEVSSSHSSSSSVITESVSDHNWRGVGYLLEVGSGRRLQTRSSEEIGSSRRRHKTTIN